MNPFRSLPFILLILAVLCFLATASLFTPQVQTWLVQSRLDELTDTHATVGSVWARFGRIDIDDLRIEHNGVIIRVPKAAAELPIVSDLLHRRFAFRSIKAKDWVVELNPLRTKKAPAEEALSVDSSATPQTSSERPRLSVYPWQRILPQLPWPAKLSLQQADLLGEVWIDHADSAPDKIHTSVQIQHLGAGQTGKVQFAADCASVDAKDRPIFFATHGKADFNTATTGDAQSLKISAEVSLSGGRLTQELTTSGTVGISRDGNDERYTLSLARAERSVLDAAWRFSGGAQLEGSWKINAHSEDVVFFTGAFPLPEFAAEGEGTFSSDRAFTRVHAPGTFRHSHVQLGTSVPFFQGVTPPELAGRFDLSRDGDQLRLGALEINLAGAAQSMRASLQQPIAWNLRTGALAFSQPDADLARVSISKLPVTGFSLGFADLQISHGAISGDLLMRTTADGWRLHSEGKVRAEDVELRQGTRTLTQPGLKAEFPLTGEKTGQNWSLTASPFAVIAEGQPVLTAELTLTAGLGASEPAKLSGHWQTDLHTLANRLNLPELYNWQVGDTTSEFSLKLGDPFNYTGKLQAVGLATGESLNAEVDLTFGYYGLSAFHFPQVTIKRDAAVSDFLLDGSRLDDGRLDLTASGKSLDPASWAWLRKPAEPARMEAGPDRQPFWKDWQGHVALAFEHIAYAGLELKESNFSIQTDPTSLRVSYGRYLLPNGGLSSVEGAILFDPAQGQAYKLKAKLGSDKFDAAALFGKPAPERDSVFEGRFSAESSVVGSGRTFDELVANTHEELHLTSQNGILRLLKTSISDAMRQSATPVSDTAATVGSAVGYLLGVKEKTGSGDIKLPPNTQAALDLTYDTAEIGYKQLTISATRSADGRIHVSDFSLTGTDQTISGQGEIAPDANQPFQTRPLQATFRFGAKGLIAERMAKLGVPLTTKDEYGFVYFQETFSLKGTLANLDLSTWHDFLAQAARAKATTSPAVPAKNPPPTPSAGGASSPVK